MCIRDRIKEAPRPPIEVQPSLPKPLSDMIVMSVAKNPAERFQTADAFRNALSQIRGSCGLPGLPKAVAAAATPVQAPPSRVSDVRPPTPVSQPAVSPAYAAATPIPTGTTPVPKAGSRQPYWILAIAVILLLATLAGARAYRSYKQNAANAAAAAIPAPSAGNQAPDQSAARTETPAEAPDKGAAPDKSKMARLNRPSGPTAEELAAQAALEQQKKLLDAMEIEDDHLESRAAAVESSLDALEQQMHQSGLGLRGDMVSARASMRSDMQKAKQALDGSDTERARRYLDQANAEISKLEGFLGRR